MDTKKKGGKWRSDKSGTPSPYHRDGIERCLGTEIAAVYRGKRVVYLTAAQ